MIKLISGTFSCAFAFLLGIIFTGTWPVQADTTGIRPVYDTQIDPVHMLMDTVILKDMDTNSLECMIENLYHEARGEGYAGMYAVALVVMNRVQDHRYPDSICEVIQQGPVRESWKTRQKTNIKDHERIFYPVRNKCQFSWYCDGKSDDMHDIDAFYMAQEISLIMIDAATGTGKEVIDITEGATHYHADYVSPGWRNDRGMTKIIQIGKHIFYRWGF